jgi:hypothetical protein
MTSCHSCYANKYIIIAFHIYIDELENERLKLNMMLDENQTSFKSERLNNKKQDIINQIEEKKKANLIIRDYLMEKKAMLLEKFLHPQGLEFV